jgi:glucose-6-phosphate isomerase
MSDPENPALTQAWTRFDLAAERAASVSIAPLFAAEPDRLERLTLDAGPLMLDLSKQSWTAEGVDACLALAQAAGVEAARERMFAGEAVNTSEDRAVMHPALRAESHQAYSAKGELVTPEVIRGRQRMWSLATDIRRGEIRGATGETFKAVLHIGIGGSDLGPRLVWEALRPLNPQIDLRFAANVDPSEAAAAMAGLDPATTLVVVVSKTFTTQETLANAGFAREWLRAALGEEGAKAHLVAVSAAPERAAAFGVDPDRVFAFWDWVGGRYSVWSAVGLSCAIALGWQDGFQAFLTGASEIDAHFRKAPLARNAPVMLALAQIWNRNGLARGARAVVPYSQRLRLLPAFLQQLEMESNGKRVRADGRPVLRATAPIVFGDAGTNGQHAFFQLLHQGTDVIPVEFVAVAENRDGPPAMQKMLLANVLAQAEALMIGRSEAEVVTELQAKGVAAEVIETLAPQRAFPGDRPSSLILLDHLGPRALGALLALYEHKTFVEGVIWGINSFDQWGVELGKAMASRILPELEGGARRAHDRSTSALIDRLRGSLPRG